MSEQQKKRQRIYNLLNAETKFLSLPLKTAGEEEMYKMSEEFIFKACKSFRRRVDTIIEKKRPYWENLLFCVYLILLFIF